MDKPFKHGALPPIPFKHKDTKNMTPTEKHIFDQWGKLSAKRIGQFLWMSEKRVNDIAARLGLLIEEVKIDTIKTNRMEPAPIVKTAESVEKVSNSCELGFVRIPKSDKPKIPTMSTCERYILENWGKQPITSIAKVLCFDEDRVKAIAIKLGLLNSVPTIDIVKTAAGEFVAKTIRQHHPLKKRRSPLSEEHKINILELVKQGISNAKIAKFLDVTLGCIKRYMYRHPEIRALKPLKVKVSKPKKEPKPKVSKITKPKETVSKPLPQKKPKDFYKIRISDKPKPQGPVTQEEINKFLETNSITICPPPGSPEVMELRPLVYDKHSRKYTRRADAEVYTNWGTR